MSETTTNPYLKACEQLGITPRPELADRSDKDAVSEDAYHRLIICIRAKNQLPDGTIWKPKKDGIEDQYSPWFIKAASGWAYYRYDGWDTGTNVGPRLEYRTLELLQEGVKEFDQYYQDYLTY